MSNHRKPGMMHVVPVDPDTSGLTHGENSYAPLPGTNVYEVPDELGQHLIAFPHWRHPVNADYHPEDTSLSDLLGPAVGRPESVEGRRSGHRPALTAEERAAIKAELRAEILQEIRDAGLIVTPAPTASEAEDEAEDEEDDEPAAPARQVTRKATPRRR